MRHSEGNLDPQLSPLRSVLNRRAAASAQARARSSEDPDEAAPDIQGRPHEPAVVLPLDPTHREIGPDEVEDDVLAEPRRTRPTQDRDGRGSSHEPRRPPPRTDTRSDLTVPLDSPLDVSIRQRAPTVRPRRRRWGLLISFLLIVIAPSTVALVYYGGLAADQYVSEVRFALRSLDGGRVPESGSSSSGSSNSGSSVTDSFIVADYVTTRQFVDELEERVGLRRVLSHPAADFWARFSPSGSVESLVEHWRSIVNSRYDLSTGILTVKVRAFTPDDSLKLAQAVLDASERLANQLTERARRDLVRSAEEELKAAEDRLAKSRLASRDFRQREGVVDPTRIANDNSDLLAKLKADLTRMRAELSSISSVMLPTAPQVQALSSRIRAAEQQIKDIESDALRSSRGPELDFGATISEYEGLELERRFAERSYISALENLQRARAMGDRQQIYLSTFARPALAEAPRYPNRPASIGLVAGLSFVAWAITLLIVLGVRDHLR